MLFYLRNIRKKLLGQNKASRYVLYAIGEILLVVIGILIAVQIDDFQEDKKKKELKQSYQNSLIKNLVQDSTDLQQQLSYYQERLNELKAIEVRLKKPGTSLDTIIKIARYEYHPSFIQMNNMSTDIIDILMSTGNINLFDQDIIQGFLVLKTAKSKSFEVIDNQMEAYADLFNTYASKYSSGSTWSVIEGELDKVTWQDVNKNELAKAFRGIFTFQKALLRSFLREKQNVLDQTTELLTYLKQQQ